MLILGSGLAVALLVTINPFTFLAGSVVAGAAIVATISAAIDAVRKAEGFFIHQGDWEHVTVRLSADRNSILGIYYAAHEKGRWYMQLTDGSRNGYKLDGDGRPIVYSALQSHAAYPYTGTTTRHGGFGNDKTDKGTAWNTAGAIVNITPGAFDSDWLKYPGLWGRKQSKKIDLAELFGESVREYGNGPIGPAMKDCWVKGEPDQPPLPQPQAPVRIDVIEKCDGPIAVAEYRGFLWVAYMNQTPMPSNPNSCTIGFATFNGKNWEDQKLIPIVNASMDQIAMASFNDELHLVCQSRNTLKWYSLALDGANRLGQWVDRTNSGGFIAGNSNPGMATTADKLGLAYRTSDHRLHFSEFDGSRWTTGPDIVDDFTGPTSALGVFNGLFCYGAMVSVQLQTRKVEARLALCYIDTQTSNLSMSNAITMLKAGRFINDQNVFAFTELDGALHIVFSSASGVVDMSLNWARLMERGTELPIDDETGYVIQPPINVGGLGLGTMAVHNTLWAVLSKPPTAAVNGSVWMVPMPCH